MSAEIISPFAKEDVPSFIRRNGGVANTSNVAQRFGWDVREAKKRLEALAQQGVIKKAGSHPWEIGSVCSWALPEVDVEELPKPRSYYRKKRLERIREAEAQYRALADQPYGHNRNPTE